MRQKRMFCLGLMTSLLSAAPGTQTLKDNWAIFSSERVEATGESISKVGFDAEAWYPARVPSTVMGALTDLGIYRDPFFSKSMASISPLPFAQPWWYRTEFTASEAGKDVVSRLVFDGINFKADIFLNGKQIAGKDAIRGVWRTYDLDVSKLIHRGKNALAVKVYKPQPGEFTIGYVDWNPAPPDANMGIFRGVTLRQSGSVSIETPFVQSKVDLKTLKEASLTIRTGLANHSAQAVSGKLKGEIESIRFEVPYTLKAGETKTLTLTPKEVPALCIENPRLWWPSNLGSPELYTLKLSAGQTTESDMQTVTFGIREVGDYLDAQGHRGYTINGRKVLIRGGGWVDDLFLREEGRNLEAQMAYVKHMNLNTVRMEGFWGSSQKLYELADRLGLFVMVGFSCQWEWAEFLQGPQDPDGDKPFGGPMKPKDQELVADYLRDSVRSLRNHPSLLAWVVGSDKLPFPESEKRYREILAMEDPTRPVLVSTKTWTSPVSGSTGTLPHGPYDYVTPNYWFDDSPENRATGFNTEAGPGPQVPPLSSLQKMFLKSRLWPINDEWDYHCARYEFSTIDRYYNAFKHRYGEPKSVEEFAYKAQAANYEATRAMFDAFGVRQPQTTGIIQWMLNGAWPKLFWQTYDYYLMPNGAFYGTRKGCQPKNIVWDCAHNTLHVVNDTREDIAGAKVRVRILRQDSSITFDRELLVDAPANGTHKLMDLPAVDATSPVSFLDLRLTSSDGKPISQNFYWMSAKPDVLDPEANEWMAMGNKSFADFKALDSLPLADVKATPQFDKNGCTVTLKNDSDRLAFLIELQLVDGASQEPLVPVLWEDNYVSLLPGESRALRVDYLAPVQPQGQTPKLYMQGWNLKRGAH